MRKSCPRPIDNLLYDDNNTGYYSYLSNIQQRAIMLLKLNHTVKVLLPTLLRPWCRVANVRHGVLILETANASWKMRLRYEQPQLLFALKAQILPSLMSIDIRINPDLTRTQELHTKNDEYSRQFNQPLKRRKRCFLSMQSAESIRYVAARSEGKLKNALERLAKLAKESTESTGVNGL